MNLKPARNWKTRSGMAVLALMAFLTLAGCAAPQAPVASTPPTAAPAQAVTAATEAEPSTPAMTTAAPLPEPTAMPQMPATVAAEPSPTQPSTASDPVATAAPAPTAAPPPAEPREIGLMQVAKADRPILLTHAGDESNRRFVVEKRGTIRVLSDGALRDDFFLDIRDRVNDRSSEQGLLGLAFAPNFSESGYFFVNYTDASGATVISRFQVGSDPNRADSATEFNVLKIDQPAPNHNGGNLLFGPDGYLWIGTGDGGAANDRFQNGQNPQTLLGKMLRLDVTTDPGRPYLVPADNPWTQADWNGSDVRDEVWAVGLRNPWRFSFDRLTGDLWIADVGQNQYEEVNLVPAGNAGGLNFGWPIMEGVHCFPESAQCDRSGFVLPVAEYTHAGHCSVTGGYVYRGAELPELTGAYIYGDFCSGVIWSLSREDGEWVSRQLLATNLAISSFGEDALGEHYVLDLNDGGIYLLSVR